MPISQSHEENLSRPDHVYEPLYQSLGKCGAECVIHAIITSYKMKTIF